jgi:putative ABC transport system permease protein
VFSGCSGVAAVGSLRWLTLAGNRETDAMNVTPGSVGLYVLCLGMVIVAALVQRVARLGSWWTVPSAALRAAVQLATVSAVLAVAMAHLWSSILVLVAMYAVAALTAARRSQATRGPLWLAVPLAVGMAAVLPPLLATGILPVTGLAIVPTFGIVLGGTMTATSVASRRALDTLEVRAGEVDAALSLGLMDWQTRTEIAQRALSDALIPNLDQARTAGLVTLPGAFIGVLLSTGSAAQACTVQVVVLISLLLSQSCAVAVVGLLVGWGKVARERSFTDA